MAYLSCSQTFYENTRSVFLSFTTVPSWRLLSFEGFLEKRVSRWQNTPTTVSITDNCVTTTTQCFSLPVNICTELLFHLVFNASNPPPHTHTPHLLMSWARPIKKGKQKPCRMHAAPMIGLSGICANEMQSTFQVPHRYLFITRRKIMQISINFAHLILSVSYTMGRCVQKVTVCLSDM